MQARLLKSPLLQSSFSRMFIRLSYSIVQSPYCKDITKDMGTLFNDLTDLVDQNEDQLLRGLISI